MRAWPRPSIMTLAGLRSRCSTPLSCAAASPAHSCRAISSAFRPAAARSAAAATPDPPRRCTPSSGTRGPRRRRRRRPGTRSDATPSARCALRPAGDRERRDRARASAGRNFSATGLPELQVVGAIHLAHAAAPDERDDAVAVAEDGAGREAAGVEGRRRGGSGARFRVAGVHLTPHESDGLWRQSTATTGAGKHSGGARELSARVAWKSRRRCGRHVSGATARFAASVTCAWSRSAAWPQHSGRAAPGARAQQPEHLGDFDHRDLAVHHPSRPGRQLGPGGVSRDPLRGEGPARSSSGERPWFLKTDTPGRELTMTCLPSRRSREAWFESLLGSAFAASPLRRDLIVSERHPAVARRGADRAGGERRRMAGRQGFEPR